MKFFLRFWSSVFFKIFQSLFIVCSQSVSVCEPVLLTKMSKNVFYKEKTVIFEICTSEIRTCNVLREVVIDLMLRLTSFFNPFIFCYPP